MAQLRYSRFMIATFSIKSTGEKVALYTTVISRGEALAKFREDYPDLIHRIGMERIKLEVDEPLSNHWTKVAAFIGTTIEVYDGRLVKVTGASVPGSAHCEAVDGLTPPIYEVSTAFLEANAIRGTK